MLCNPQHMFPACTSFVDLYLTFANFDEPSCLAGDVNIMSPIASKSPLTSHYQIPLLWLASSVRVALAYYAPSKVEATQPDSTGTQAWVEHELSHV